MVRAMVLVKELVGLKETLRSSGSTLDIMQSLEVETLSILVE